MYSIKKFLIIFAGCTFSTTVVDGANILFFFGILAQSHRAIVWPYVDKLLETGHNVTFLSSYPPKYPDSRVSEFTPRSVLAWVKEAEIVLDITSHRVGKDPSTSWFIWPDYSYVACEKILSSPETLAWVEQSQFDLVVIDAMFNDCGLGLAHKFRAQHILFGTSTLLMWMYDSFGVPVESSWIPDVQYYYPQEMSFLERLHSTINPIIWNALRSWHILPRLERLMKTKLNMPDMPSLIEIEKNVSLILLNTHFSNEYARSLPPLIVPVGGMHIKERTTHNISEKLDYFIHKGDNGFIFVNFGDNILLSNTSEEFLDVIFSSFKKFRNIQFLWKWQGKHPKEIPANVLLQEQMPQDLLAHRKIRAFITNAEESSVQEAVHWEVPMIAFPCFAEQDYNAECIERMGLGIRLEIVGLTPHNLEDGITKILDEEKYWKNIKQVSRIFKDRPKKPLDTALWWTEYVLRHKDTSFLKPLSIYQSWYESRLLDVWLFIFVTLATTLTISVMFVYKMLACLICRSKIVPKVKVAKLKTS